MSTRPSLLRAEWLRPALVLLLATGAGAAVGAVLLARGAAPQERSITIFARQYAFDPPVLRVNQGDRLRLRLVSLDVTHGFYLEGHDLDAEIVPQQQQVLVRRPSQGGPPVAQDEIVVNADRTGKFRYRCSHTCGALHPFMSGELIVAPNHLLHGGVGACFGLVAGFALLAARAGRTARSRESSNDA